MNCTSCKGPFHPESGHFWAADVPVCGPCIRSFFSWVKAYTAPRKGIDFHKEAMTSIKPTNTTKEMK